jgi:putative ABC transport system ATP-binding protein
VLIEAVNVRRTFSPGEQGLRSATLSVPSGTSVAIVGPSGSGKTTLLTLLGLLERPTAGTLRVLGHDAREGSAADATALRRTGLSFIFQGFHLIPHLSVFENVLLGLYHRDTPRAERSRLVHEQLTTLGLADHAHALPKTLSGGEQQRVAIARALVRQPRLLLCDEPTGNLDSANSEIVVTALLGSVAPTRSVVIVTHDEKLAARCSHQIWVLDGHAQGVAHG